MFFPNSFFNFFLQKFRTKVKKNFFNKENYLIRILQQSCDHNLIRKNQGFLKNKHFFSRENKKMAKLPKQQSTRPGKHFKDFFWKTYNFAFEGIWAKKILDFCIKFLVGFSKQHSTSPEELFDEYVYL